jgi:hypothetical protein
MLLRSSTFFLILCVLALWPQSLVLCTGGDGHLGFEPEGAPCCPVQHDHEDKPEDCADCSDTGKPDLTAVPGLQPIAKTPVRGRFLPRPVPVCHAPADLPAAFAADERATVVLTV